MWTAGGKRLAIGWSCEFPDWVEQLWGELRFKELVGQEIGEGYQRLFHQVMKAIDGDDFLDVRPTGKYGDYKCDGWEMHSATCYAVYGPFTRKTPDQVRRKISSDLHSAIRAWPEMRKWRLVHNDYAGLSHDDPFEAMLASIVFCVQAVRLWEAATGEVAEL